MKFCRIKIRKARFHKILTAVESLKIYITLIYGDELFRFPIAISTSIKPPISTTFGVQSSLIRPQSRYNTYQVQHYSLVFNFVVRPSTELTINGKPPIQ